MIDDVYHFWKNNNDSFIESTSTIINRRLWNACVARVSLDRINAELLTTQRWMIKTLFKQLLIRSFIPITLLKMWIKFYQKFFLLVKIIFNIVEGNYYFLYLLTHPYKWSLRFLEGVFLLAHSSTHSKSQFHQVNSVA